MLIEIDLKTIHTEYCNELPVVAGSGVGDDRN